MLSKIRNKLRKILVVNDPLQEIGGSSNVAPVTTELLPSALPTCLRSAYREQAKTVNLMKAARRREGIRGMMERVGGTLKDGTRCVKEIDR